MADLSNALSLLREKVEEEITREQPYEAMLYCQSFLARKKKALSSNELTSCLIDGSRILIDNGEITYAAKLISWYIEADMLQIDKASEILDFFANIPHDKSICFVDVIYLPFSKFAEKSIGGEPLLMMLNTLCAPVFEAFHYFRQAMKCFHSINDVSGVARVLNALALRGYPSEYPLFFVRSYLHMLGSNLVIQSDAFFVEVENEYMETYIKENPNQDSCQCWKMCEIIHDLEGLEGKKDGPKFDKAGIFLHVLESFLPFLEKLDSHLINLMEIVGIRVFKAQRKRKQPIDPLHSLMTNIFSDR